MAKKAKFNLATDGMMFEAGKVYKDSEVEGLDLTNFEDVADEEVTETAKPAEGTFAEEKKSDLGTQDSSGHDAGGTQTGYANDGTAPKEALE